LPPSTYHLSYALTPRIFTNVELWRYPNAPSQLLAIPKDSCLYSLQIRYGNGETECPEAGTDCFHCGAERDMIALISGAGEGKRSVGLPLGWEYMAAAGEVGSMVGGPQGLQRGWTEEAVGRYHEGRWNGPYRWDVGERRYVACL